MTSVTRLNQICITYYREGRGKEKGVCSEPRGGVSSRWEPDWLMVSCISGWKARRLLHFTPAFCFNMAMKFSRSSGDIASAEQSPTPHSAPRMQYLSCISCLFLKHGYCLRERLRESLLLIETARSLGEHKLDVHVQLWNTKKRSKHQNDRLSYSSSFPSHQLIQSILSLSPQVSTQLPQADLICEGNHGDTTWAYSHVGYNKIGFQNCLFCVTSLVILRTSLRTPLHQHYSLPHNPNNSPPHHSLFHYRVIARRRIRTGSLLLLIELRLLQQLLEQGRLLEPFIKFCVLLLVLFCQSTPQCLLIVALARSRWRNRIHNEAKTLTVKPFEKLNLRQLRARDRLYSRESREKSGFSCNSRKI